jgi:CRISPR-associated protein Csm4
MQLDCWNIQGEGFHFGRHGLGQEQSMAAMPSDSLFAALVAVLARTDGKEAVEKFCAPFTGENTDPPFVLSSTFPFAGTVRFLPVPMLSRGGEAQGVQAKKLKRVQFVSEEIFRSLLKGEALAKFFDEKLTLQNGFGA